MTDPSRQVVLTPHFVRVVKRLRKKYPRVAETVQGLIEILTQGETPGDQIQGVGYTAYKVRLPNPDAQKGKSSGYRVVYYIKKLDRIILLVIYAKTEQVDITSEEIRQLIDEFEQHSE